MVRSSTDDFVCNANSGNFEVCLVNVLTEKLCFNLLSIQFSPRKVVKVCQRWQPIIAFEFGENMCFIYFYALVIALETLRPSVNLVVALSYTLSVCVLTNTKSALKRET